MPEILGGVGNLTVVIPGHRAEAGIRTLGLKRGIPCIRNPAAEEWESLQRNWQADFTLAAEHNGRDAERAGKPNGNIHRTGT